MNTPPPRLDDLRRAIDEIDDGLLELLCRRFDVVAEVKQAKSAEAAATPLRPAREMQILKRLVAKAGKSLVDKLSALEDTLVQKRVVDGQTVINFPQRLNQYFIYLRSAIDSSDAGITDGQQARLAALSEDWARQQRSAGTLLGDELAAFNRLVRDRNVPAVVVK